MEAQMADLRRQIEEEEQIQQELKQELSQQQKQTNEIVSELKGKTKDLSQVNKFYEQGKGDDAWDNLVGEVKQRHAKMVQVLQSANFGKYINNILK